MGLGMEFTAKEQCCSPFSAYSCLTSFGHPVSPFGRAAPSTAMHLLIWGKANTSKLFHHSPSCATKGFTRYVDFYENRKDAIEQQLQEIQGYDNTMLAAAIEKGILKSGQSCRHVSWERLDKEAVIALSQGIGSAPLASFCRVICRGARRAGLPDLMLWRIVDGMCAQHLHEIPTHAQLQEHMKLEPSK